jgi:hypothetical protein
MLADNRPDIVLLCAIFIIFLLTVRTLLYPHARFNEPILRLMEARVKRCEFVRAFPETESCRSIQYSLSCYYFKVVFTFCLEVLLYACNETNLIHYLFIFSLFRHYTSTCFGLCIYPSSGRLVDFQLAN